MGQNKSLTINTVVTYCKCSTESLIQTQDPSLTLYTTVSIYIYSTTVINNKHSHVFQLHVIRAGGGVSLLCRSWLTKSLHLQMLKVDAMCNFSIDQSIKSNTHRLYIHMVHNMYM